MQQKPIASFVPPIPLAPDTIQRAREGWEAACDPHVRETIADTFDRFEQLSQGESDGRVNGEVRRILVRSLMHNLFRIRVDYPERIPTEPALLVANHLNHLDPFLLLSEIPAAPYCYILGDARSLYNHWWKRAILKRCQGMIPLPRRWKEELAVIEGAKSGREDLKDLAEKIDRDVPNGKSLETLRQIDRAIQTIFDRGDSLLLFPEGKLGAEEGNLEVPLKPGAVRYALRSGVEIVPVAIVGTKNLYFRKELILRFGKPLKFPQSKRPKASEIQAATEELQAALMALLPTDYQESDELKLFRYFLNRMFW
jgi:1-acyl-sn-glycerol-3-phosphate acyltransferase